MHICKRTFYGFHRSALRSIFCTEEKTKRKLKASLVLLINPPGLKLERLNLHWASENGLRSSRTWKILESRLGNTLLVQSPWFLLLKIYTYWRVLQSTFASDIGVNLLSRRSFILHRRSERTTYIFFFSSSRTKFWVHWRLLSLRKLCKKKKKKYE